MPPICNMHKSVVSFIDVSYVVYTRWYSTRKSLVISDADVHLVLNEDHPNHQKFKASFVNGFKDDIIKLANYHVKIQDRRLRQTVVLVYDCAHENNWRVAVYPEYKVSAPYKNKHFDPRIFNVVFETIIPSMVRDYGFREMMHPCAEADDIIGTIKRGLQLSHPNALTYHICSNDNDYLQLYCVDTRIFNLKGEDLYKREHAKLLEKLATKDEASTSSGNTSPGWQTVRSRCTTFDTKTVVAAMLMSRLLKGDSSDNVPCAGSFSNNFIKDVVENPGTLEQHFLENPDIANKYQRNKKLMDMRCIDDRVQSEIIAKWNSLGLFQITRRQAMC